MNLCKTNRGCKIELVDKLSWKSRGIVLPTLMAGSGDANNNIKIWLLLYIFTLLCTDITVCLPWRSP